MKGSCFEGGGAHDWRFMRTDDSSGSRAYFVDVFYCTRCLEQERVSR